MASLYMQYKFVPACKGKEPGDEARQDVNITSLHVVLKLSNQMLSTCVAYAAAMHKGMFVGEVQEQQAY